MFVSVLDPRVAPIRLSAGVIRVFPIDPSIASVERPLGAPGAATIIGGVIAIAGLATTVISVSLIPLIRSSSTVFGPNVFHPALRRDSTVVFVRQPGV